jgi:hypothetical protein
MKSRRIADSTRTRSIFLGQFQSKSAMGLKRSRLEAAAGASSLETAASAVLLLDVDDMLDELLRAPALLCRRGDEVVEIGCDNEKAEGPEACFQVAHGASSGSMSKQSSASWS